MFTHVGPTNNCFFLKHEWKNLRIIKAFQDLWIFRKHIWCQYRQNSETQTLRVQITELRSVCPPQVSPFNPLWDDPGVRHCGSPQNPDPHHHQLREANPRTAHLFCLNRVFTDWFSSLFNNQPITRPLTSKQVSSAPIRSLTLIDSWFVVIRFIRRDSLWFDIYVVTRRPFWVLMVSCIKRLFIEYLEEDSQLWPYLINI